MLMPRGRLLALLGGLAALSLFLLTVLTRPSVEPLMARPGERRVPALGRLSAGPSSDDPDASPTNVPELIEQLIRNQTAYLVHDVAHPWQWFVDPATYNDDADGPLVATDGRNLRARHPHFPAGAAVPRPHAIPVGAELSAAQVAVRQMVQHAWKGYRDHAWGLDELLPLKNRGKNWIASPASSEGALIPSPQTRARALGVTLIESLGTLYLTACHEEFEEAIGYLSSAEHSFDIDGDVSVFEATIRVLGGLLSAYELTGRPVLLDKAFDLGSRLIFAFVRPATAATGRPLEADDDDKCGRECRTWMLPLPTVNLRTRTASAPAWLQNSKGAYLSESTSLQLEFRKLTYHTGYAIFDYLAQKAFLAVARHVALQPHGLFPRDLDRRTGMPQRGTVSIGSRADSFYEYQAKMAALTGFSQDLYGVMWVHSVEGIQQALLRRLNITHSFISDAEFSTFDARYRLTLAMDHLACFLPGALAVGRHAIRRFVELASALEEHSVTVAEWCSLTEAAHADLRRGVLNTCVGMYWESPSGLAPEIFHLQADTRTLFAQRASRGYRLRPETLEALYYSRDDPARRAQARQIIAAVELKCRVNAGGYAGLIDVTADSQLQNSGHEHHSNVMESYFVSETLKYAFLAVAEDPAWLHVLDERLWVFNTEGHPLRIMRRAPVLPRPPEHGTGWTAGPSSDWAA